MTTRLDYRDPKDERKRFSAPRWALLILFFATTFIASVAYSGPSFGTVAYRLIVDGGILLLWIVAATGYGGLLLKLVLPEESDPLPILRFVTAAGLGLGSVSLGLLALGLAGFLNLFVAWLLLIGGLGLGIAAVVRIDTEANRTRLVAWLNEPAGFEWLFLLAIPFIVPAIVGAMAPAGLLWTPDEPHGYDVIEYHLQVPREWYEAGRVIPLHHNAFSFFPFNVEMHFLLAMHLHGGPWAGMYLAQLMHGTFVLLTVVAVYGFARTRSSRSVAVIASLAAASVPALSQLAAIAYDEGGFLLFGTLAIGWALRATFDDRHRIRRHILAGLMAGFACGTKLTAAPEVLLAIMLVSAGVALGTVPKSADRTLRGCLIGIGCFGLFGLLTFSPWLIRNIAWAHNPVFPEATNLLGRGHFSHEQIERWQHAHSAQPAQRPPGARVRAFWDQVAADWRYGYVFLPMVILAVIIGRRRPQTMFLAGLLLVLLVVWLGFTHLQGRFFVLAVPIGALLIAEVSAASVSGRLPSRSTIAIFTALVCLAAVLGAMRLNWELYSHLYRSRIPLADLLGDDDIGWALPKVVDDIPADRPVILVGDARAFWYYKVPMTRLRYRTVFDVDTSNGRGLIDAWIGPSQSRDGGWLLIFPDELRRFVKTYQPMPPLPPSVDAHGDEPYLVPPQKR